MLTKYLLEYLIAGTRGGKSRAQIIFALMGKSMNMNQISKQVKMDYKTIQHHLKVLEDNNVISVIKKGEYGAMYHLSADFEANIEHFKDIWKRTG